DRALAAGVQHHPAAQLVGLSAPGTGGDSAVVFRFRYAPATDHGRRTNAEDSNLTTGVVGGGRSVRELELRLLQTVLGDQRRMRLISWPIIHSRTTEREMTLATTAMPF